MKTAPIVTKPKTRKYKKGIDKHKHYMLSLKRSLNKLKERVTNMSSTEKVTKDKKVKQTKRNTKRVMAGIGLVGLSYLAFNGAQGYIRDGKLREAFAIGVVTAFLYMVLGVFL